MTVVSPLARLHLVVPDGVDDPARPSGGNAYDRRLRRELLRLGLDVREHSVAGAWPRPAGAALDVLGRLVAGLEDGACLLVDGLVASAAGPVLLPHAGRLRLAVLVHLPLGVDDVAARASEGAVFRAAGRLVTTSAWCRDWVVEHYQVPGSRITVARPGVDPAPLAPRSRQRDGGELLCVAAVTPVKGHDVLLEALGRLSDLDCRLTCVGPLDRAPAFVALMRRLAEQLAPGRVRFTGPLPETAMGEVYARADLLVLPSRVETYGMVVTEALARGVPVVASQVGGVPEALGGDSDDGDDGGHDDVPTLPHRGDHGPMHRFDPDFGALVHDHREVGGVLVPPDDAAALAAQLRTWLTDPAHRERLRAAARARRPQLHGWDVTAAEVAAALAEPAEPNPPRLRMRWVGDAELSDPGSSLSAAPATGALDEGSAR